MNDYKIPEEVKKEFTKERVLYFFCELIDIFNIPRHPTYWRDTVLMESTAGWCQAFKKMCINYGLEDILYYYNALEWYDSDVFDGEFGELLLGYGLVEEGEQDIWQLEDVVGD